MNKKPIYNIKKSYLENAEYGPFFEGQLPVRQLTPKDQWVDFLGKRVASRLGVPAGPLLNSRWISFAAKAGFDIVTYKTIRSAPHPSHPVPNMIYVDCERMLAPQEEGNILYQKDDEKATFEHLAVTNSFGIPSRDIDYLLKDIGVAKAALAPYQTMIVSFVGTPRENEDFVQDFVKAAFIATEGGGEILEADFSCPNVKSKEGSLFKNVEAIFTISKAIKKAIPHLPLIIKVGVVDNLLLLEDIMKAAVRGGCDAICGINTMSMQVLKKDNTPALGENRLRSGVCGAPIRDTALDFIRKASHINQKEKLGLTIMGTGGVIEPEHFDLFFEAGASVAMSGVGMMYDPFLAMKYHER